MAFGGKERKTAAALYEKSDLTGRRSGFSHGPGPGRQRRSRDGAVLSTAGRVVHSRSAAQRYVAHPRSKTTPNEKRGVSGEGMMRNKRDRNSGFTLVEALVTVAILVILLSVSAVGVAQSGDHLKITELDNAAWEIYMAAQNRAVLLQNSGRLAPSAKLLNSIGSDPSGSIILSNRRRWRRYLPQCPPRWGRPPGR